MINKKIAAAILAASVLAGCTSAPVFANIDPDYTWTEETAEYTEYEEYEDPAIVRDVPVEQAEPAPEPEPENNPPLTPAGNLTLVDNVTTSSGTKQFLTLTSRAGNFYYIVIDYDKDGNENAHFLNQVDERDLISLMDEDEAKELEERLAAKKAEEEAAKAAQETTPTPTPGPEPTPEPEKTITIAGYEFSQKTVVAIIALVVIGLICLAGFLFLTFRKKPDEKKPDPDADYDEDYDDEIDIPEDDEEDFDI